MWVMKWAELLQVRSSNQVSYKAMLLYYNWLQDKIAHNVPINEMVQELLGASGGTFNNPATNYYQIEPDTLKVAENTAQVFMGMRIQCAQCHNHPFDRWTMDDYYSFAAFFAPDRPQARRRPARDDRLQQRRRRSEAPGRRTRHGAEIPRRATPGRQGQGPPRGARRVAGLAGESLLRAEPGEHRLGALLRPRHHRAGGRRAHQQSRVEPRTARRTREALHGIQLRLQEAGPRHLHVAHLPALHAAERDEQARRRGTSRTARSAASGPRCCSTASAR